MCGASLGDDYIDAGTLARGRSSPPGVTGRAGLQGAVPSAGTGQNFRTAPAVAVKNFIGAGPEPQVGPGLSAMLVTDLVNIEGAMRPRVVEWERRADILREIEFSNSKWADPGTRIARGQLIEPDVFIEGTVTSTGNGEVSWHIRMIDATTGEVIGVDQGSTLGPEFFQASGSIAKRLNALLWTWWQRKQSKRPLHRQQHQKQRRNKPQLRSPLVS
jgi:curli biogenesis system outer membrane secretion channel CsgG